MALRCRGSPGAQEQRTGSVDGRMDAWASQHCAHANYPRHQRCPTILRQPWVQPASLPVPDQVSWIRAESDMTTRSSTAQKASMAQSSQAWLSQQSRSLGPQGLDWVHVCSVSTRLIDTAALEKDRDRWSIGW